MWKFEQKFRPKTSKFSKSLPEPEHFCLRKISKVADQLERAFSTIALKGLRLCEQSLEILV